MVDPTMYIFLNKGLNMTVGKAAAQAGHAAVRGFRLTGENSNLTRLWDKAKGEKKIVLAGRDEPHMHTILRYLKDRNIGCEPIIDEGHTETPPHSFTAIGCELVDKNLPEIEDIFADFELYKDQEFIKAPLEARKKVPIEWSGWQYKV